MFTTKKEMMCNVGYAIISYDNDNNCSNSIDGDTTYVKHANINFKLISSGSSICSDG